MIKPLRGYILIEIEKADDISSGGVYLPENSQDKPAKGKVISLAEEYPMSNKEYPNYAVESGDIVYYKKWSGNEIKENGKEYVFIKFEDVLGVISE